VRPADSTRDAVGRATARWADGARRHALAIVLVTLPAAFLLGAYAVRNLGLNTDTGAMISEELPWRQAFLAFDEAFPQFGDEIHVLITGRTPDLAERAHTWLSARMREETEIFERVWTPGAGAFFERNALLYLDIEELDSLSDHLANLGPWIRRLEGNPTLPGFVTAVDSALWDAREAPDPVLAPVLELVARTLYQQERGWGGEISWSEVMRGRPATLPERRRHIIALPRHDYARTLPAGPAMERLRELREILPVPVGSVEVRITGAAAIKHESIGAATDGARGALLLSLLLVTTVLILGLRSARLIVACLITLGVGLSATAAFAAAVVGQLNLISIAFAVLYVGLGVDYCIHLSLGYQEALAESGEPVVAIQSACGRIGSSIFLSAITSAAAFYAFIPTRFTGVAELGLISGTGMLISLVVTLTVLPALLTLLSPPAPRYTTGVSPARSRHERPGSEALSVMRRHSGPVLVVAVILAAGSALSIPGLRFAYRPIDLADPETESVQTFEDLAREGGTASLTVSIVVPDSAAARRTAARVATLTGVGETATIDHLVPSHQVEKLAIVRRVAETLSPMPADDSPSVAVGAEVSLHVRVLEALKRLEANLARKGALADPETGVAARRLRTRVSSWLRNLDRWPVETQTAMLDELEYRLVGTLGDQLRALRRVMHPSPITRDDLPADVREWWIAVDGRERVEVRPDRSLDTRTRLRSFVERVRSEQPDLTGVPVSDLESGRVAIRALLLALGLAGTTTFLLLVVQFRSGRAALLVEGPLLLAGLLTVGLATLLRVPFNFANLIALPLLLGVGVDNGIHMVHRARTSLPGELEPERTSTGRAIVVSCFTTLASFGSLALSRHQGIQSMGQLLSIGMVCVLLSTLIVLPALLAREEPSGTKMGAIGVRSPAGTAGA